MMTKRLINWLLMIGCCTLIGCGQSTQQATQDPPSAYPTMALTLTTEMTVPPSYQATIDYVDGVLNAMSDYGYPEHCRNRDQFAYSASAITISPSGNRLALLLERRLYIIDLPLSTQEELALPTRLSPYATHWVAWLSPDRLLTTSARVNGTGLYILDMVGNETELIAPSDSVKDYALAAERESVALVEGQFLYTTLNLLSIADKSQLPLTTLTEVVEVESPSWHPNGSQIVFSAEAFGDLEGYQNIFTVDAKNGSLTQLTSLACDFQPRWSPDSDHIAFLRAFQDEPTALIIINLVTGKETIITTADNVAGEYQWNARGDRLSYMLVSSGSLQSVEAVYSYDISTEQTTKIGVGCCISATAWGLNEQLWLLLTKDRETVWLYQVDSNTGAVLHAYLLNGG